MKTVTEAPRLRQIDAELWVAETKLRFVVEMGRRMTVVRLRDDELLVHSPAELSDELRRDLDNLGEVRFVVPASKVHGHLSMEAYAAQYPSAEIFAAPGLAERRRDVSFDAELGERPDPRWAEVLDQTILRGHRFVDEVIFLHRPSRSLLVGDAVFNIEPSAPLSTRVWAWGPRLRAGAVPPPLFRAGIRDRQAARASIDRILTWDFDRIVVGHGRILESGGREAFKSAWDWLGD